MKSMKTFSLILVASTLVPASAHAWSWSDLVKPAAAVTGLAGFITGSFFAARYDTNDPVNKARMYCECKEKEKKHKRHLQQKIDILEVEYARSVSNFIQGRIMATTTRRPTVFPDTALNSNPKRFLYVIQRNYPAFFKDYLSMNNNYVANYKNQVASLQGELDNASSNYEQNVSTRYANALASATTKYHYARALKISSLVVGLAYALYSDTNTVVQNYLNNR